MNYLIESDGKKNWEKLYIHMHQTPKKENALNFFGCQSSNNFFASNVSSEPYWYFPYRILLRWEPKINFWLRHRVRRNTYNRSEMTITRDKRPDSLRPGNRLSGNLYVPSVWLWIMIGGCTSMKKNPYMFGIWSHFLLGGVA